MAVVVTNGPADISRFDRILDIVICCLTKHLAGSVGYGRAFFGQSRPVEGAPGWPAVIAGRAM